MQIIFPKTSCQLLKKPDIFFPYDPVLKLFGNYPKEFQTHVHKNFTEMFITTLFIIVKSQMQPRCPSEDKWMNELTNP